MTWYKYLILHDQETEITKQPINFGIYFQVYFVKQHQTSIMPPVKSSH